MMISKEEIKQIKSLKLKKFRKEKSLFIVEGPKMLKEAIAYAPQNIKTIYYTESSILDLDISNFNSELITEKELNQISCLKQPQGIVTICNYLPSPSKGSEFKIALDNIQDPGNMGTILRLAAWFGVTEILASTNCVDIYNPKVVQASMGAIFNVQVNYLALSDFFELNKLPVYGAMLSGDNIYKSKLSPKGILLMGNEGNGVSDKLQKYISKPLYIPKFGQGESLNVAMATGIMLSEFCREDKK